MGNIPAMKYLTLAALAFSLLATPAAAELKQTSPDGALIEHQFQIDATPGQAWELLFQPERWWPPDHTWSGDSANLSLDANAGGCFCERWNGASAEHARVVMAQPARNNIMKVERNLRRLTLAKVVIDNNSFFKSK